MTLLTTQEAAAILRLSRQSVCVLCNEKKLKCIRHSERGRRLILRESIDAYIATLTDSVEAFTPVVVAFDDVSKRMKERTEKIRGMV